MCSKSLTENQQAILIHIMFLGVLFDSVKYISDHCIGKKEKQSIFLFNYQKKKSHLIPVRWVVQGHHGWADTFCSAQRTQKIVFFKFWLCFFFCFSPLFTLTSQQYVKVSFEEPFSEENSSPTESGLQIVKIGTATERQTD